jgi:2-dehydropantoate 2-reductase
MRAIQSQGGLRVVSRAEEFLAPLGTSSRVPENIPENAILFLTVQSPDVETTLTQWRGFSSHPLVTWQNGLKAEGLAAQFFPHLYGGVVRFTSTLLRPGEVRLRAPGSLVLGHWPEGKTSLTAEIAGDLAGAGFQVAESPRIGDDKALKLLVNLVSGPAVLMKRTDKEPILAAVQVALLEEASRVFGAAGIRAEPTSGIGETEDTLLALFKSGGQKPDTAGGVYNSTWQNLEHRRPRLENAYYHGEIIRLGRENGIPTPVNARALEVLEWAQRAGLGPDVLDRDAFRARFADVVDFDRLIETEPASTPSGLEI